MMRAQYQAAGSTILMAVLLLLGTGGVGTDGKASPGAGAKGSAVEIKASRWEFDFTGSPKQHAEKLSRVGMIVAVPDPKAAKAEPGTAPLLLITDLKPRPVTLKPAMPGQFNNSVKWYNVQKESIQGLAKELPLPFVPSFVVLILPKDREAKIAAVEQQYANQHRIDPARIEWTTFDFRLQKGVYEPVVIKMKQR